MSRFFFGSSSPAPGTPLDPAAEVEQLLSALGEADLIMNDEIETAEKNLSEGNSVFHVVSLS